MSAPQQIQELPELSTRRAVSEFTGISVPTLARWAAEGRGPQVTKLGNSVRYRKTDVLEWLDASRKLAVHG